MSMSDEEAKPEAGTTIAQSNSLADRAARIRAEYEAAGQAEENPCGRAGSAISDQPRLAAEQKWRYQCVYVKADIVPTSTSGRKSN